MSGTIFKDVKQWESEQVGVRVRFPLFYHDNTSLTAIYTASTGKVRGLLPHVAMKPVEMSPGRCLVAFIAFEYRRPDIPPYNEFSIAFLIRFGKIQIPGITAVLQVLRRDYAAYVWQLPVTTETARILGIELYGYPKSLADITFTKTEEEMSCRLSQDEQEILTLTGKVLPTTRGRVMRYVTYSIVDGIPVSANMITDPVSYAQSWGGGAATLRLGAIHPICQALRELHLSPRPVMYQFIPTAEAVLFAPKNLVDR